MFAGLRAAGITPIVTLYHFTLPTWVAARIGLRLDPLGGELAETAERGRGVFGPPHPNQGRHQIEPDVQPPGESPEERLLRRDGLLPLLLGREGAVSIPGGPGALDEAGPEGNLFSVAAVDPDRLADHLPERPLLVRIARTVGPRPFGDPLLDLGLLGLRGLDPGVDSAGEGQL